MVDITKVWNVSALRQLSSSEWQELQQHLFGELRKALGLDIRPTTIEVDVEDCVISVNFVGAYNDLLAELVTVEGILGLQADDSGVQISTSVFIFIQGRRAKTKKGDYLEFEFRNDSGVPGWHCQGWTADQYGEFKSIDRPGLLR